MTWRATDHKIVYLAGLMLGAGGLVLGIYTASIWSEYRAKSPGNPAPFGDFFAPWTYGRITAARPAAVL